MHGWENSKSIAQLHELLHGPSIYRKSHVHTYMYLLYQWTLVITNPLGPQKLLCYIKILWYHGYNKQRNTTTKFQFGIEEIILNMRIWYLFFDNESGL